MVWLAMQIQGSSSQAELTAQHIASQLEDFLMRHSRIPSERMESTMQSDGTQHQALQSSSMQTQADHVQGVSSPSASSTDLDSLTEQATLLLQQMQAGMQHARLSRPHGSQHEGMQSQASQAMQTALQVDFHHDILIVFLIRSQILILHCVCEMMTSQSAKLIICWVPCRL